jgi:RNA 3'-terminal phosphate cyclase (ATP)
VLTIDGSQGEGGGQILRSSLALSLVTGRPFRITRIRAGREKPGLMRQHLVAVQAAAKVGGAKVTGAALGSTELVFEPGDVRSGEYHFAIGTAGSASLVLQTVLPPLLTADNPSRLTIEGGTYNMHAPPFDFLARTFVPVINRLGPKLKVKQRRPGFYPAGGGCIEVTITPPSAWEPLELIERGRPRGRSARALVGRLPVSIAERELRVIRRKIGWDEEELHAEEVRDSRGPGNVIMLTLDYEHVTEVFTGFGARRIRAEQVARSALDEACHYLDSDAPVGEHLADQLLLPLAIGAGGTFRTTTLTDHAVTNIAVLRAFLDLEVRTEPEPGGAYRVSVSSPEHDPQRP